VPQFATNVALAYPNVIALANGKVFVIGQQVGIDSSDILDGGQYLIEWDSNTNAFQIAEPKPGDPFLFEVDSLARSADHKWAIFSADKFYLYSSDDDTFTTVPLSTVNPPQDQYNVTGYAMNADGSKIAVASALQTTFLDRSFNVLGITPIPYAFQRARTYVTFTPDGTKLLLQYSLPLAIEELDATSYTALGYFSGAMAAEDNDERLLAVDVSGRAFAGVSGGVRVIDTTGPIVPNPAENDPLAGAVCGPPLLTAAPLNSSVPTTVVHYGSYASSTYYFGGQPALSLPDTDQIQIPASSVAGPVDIECIGPDNNTALDAQLFSYGVDPIGLSANLFPPSGNVSPYVSGFGFSSTPSVSIGGQSTTTSSVSFYNLSSLDAAVITVPAGTPSSTSALSITSENGSGALTQAVTYIPSATVVPASGLLQLLYDTHRNLLYALESSQIDVLDPISLQWRVPISLPAAGNSGTYNAMAISPDGAFLAAASPNGFLAIIDPDNPSHAPAVATNSTSSDQTGSVAITKSNIAVVTGSPNILVNLSTQQVTPLYALAGDLIRASADGSHLYGVALNNSSGQVYAIDPTTFSVKTRLPFADDFWSDLAVNNNGSQFAAILGAPFATGVIVGVYSNDLHLLNYNVWPSTSLPDTPQVLGAVFSPGGKVIVAPLEDSIEFWDVGSDTLRARLMTPEALSVIVYPIGAVAPQIALDTAGQNIFAISASGLTVMTLAEPVDDLPANAWTRRAIFSKPVSAFSGSKRRRMAAMRSLLVRPPLKNSRPSHLGKSNAD
jgi:hypothetical protein